jgi:methanogenic corrinoid protein MtbC1
VIPGTSTGQSGPGVTTFVDRALAGEVRPAVGLALELLDSGWPPAKVVSDLLAPAQREVGRRWETNMVSVADEHIATVSAEAAVHALAMTQVTLGETRGQVVLACAEGEWHGLPAHMFAVQLEDAGFNVRFLGASTPAVHVAKLLARRPPDALIVSCTMPIHFAGVTRLVDAAHAQGLPALVGGGAFVNGGLEHARRLGGDGWARDWAEAVTTLDAWRARPPTVPNAPTALPVGALQLERDVPGWAITADWARVDRPSAQGDESRRLGLVAEDLRLVLQFLVAAHLVQSEAVFLDFLTWLGPVLATRGLPHGILRSELEGMASSLATLPMNLVAVLRSGASSLPSAP